MPVAFYHGVFQRKNLAAKSRQIAALSINANKFGITSHKLAPLIMMSRAALTKCVRGNTFATNCIASGVSSKENQMPDKNIIGQVAAFNKPPANSSLAVRQAISKASAIMAIAPIIAVISKSKPRPTNNKSNQYQLTIKISALLSTTKNKREATCADKNVNAEIGVACKRFSTPFLR